MWPRGGIGTPRGCPWGPPEHLWHEVPPAYDSLAIQVLAYQISTVYLQKCGFYVLGVVLTPLGGCPWGDREPLRHGFSLAYNSIAFQVPTYQISTIYHQKCGFYGLRGVFGLVRTPRALWGLFQGGSGQIFWWHLVHLCSKTCLGLKSIIKPFVAICLRWDTYLPSFDRTI